MVHLSLVSSVKTRRGRPGVDLHHVPYRLLAFFLRRVVGAQGEGLMQNLKKVYHMFVSSAETMCFSDQLQQGAYTRTLFLSPLCLVNVTD